MPSPEYEILANLARPAPAAVQTNIPVVEESGATGEVAEAYDYFRSNFGRPDVPGILKCFSSSPLLMKQIIAMSSTLLFSDGNLGRRHKEMLASYVSSLNACPYCLDSHAFFLRVHGGETLVSPILDNQLNSVAITLQNARSSTSCARSAKNLIASCRKTYKSFATLAGKKNKSPDRFMWQQHLHSSIVWPTPLDCPRKGFSI
jgi:AhpD family alkylhydroperoxidase